MQDIKEIWKDIPEFRGIYQASNLGRIRRINGRVIKQKFHQKSAQYIYICLSVDGKRIVKSVHSIVAKTFVDNPFNLPQVNHKDGNKLNNLSGNLEWVTRSENAIHAIKLGFYRTIPAYKLITKSKAITICNLNLIGYNQNDLAALFKISQSTISKILLGKKQYAKYNPVAI